MKNGKLENILDRYDLSWLFKYALQLNKAPAIECFFEKEVNIKERFDFNVNLLLQLYNQNLVCFNFCLN